MIVNVCIYRLIWVILLFMIVDLFMDTRHPRDSVFDGIFTIDIHGCKW